VTVDGMLTGPSIDPTTFDAPPARATCSPSSPHTTSTAIDADALAPVESVTVSSNVMISDC